jgi:Mg2+ transporter MgtE
MTHKRLSELHPADVADILEQLDPQQRTAVFDHLDKQQAAETFSELEDEYQTDMIDDLSEHDAAGLLAQMEPDDAADILGDLPYDKAEKLLWLMGVSDERRIRSLLGYKDKSAGGIMTPEFVALPETVTVSAAIEHIRALDEDHGSVHYVYTLDASGQLIGAFSLRDLVLAEPETQIGDIAERDLITVTPELDQEEVAELISKYDLLAIPVVDESKKPLGIVTVDDAMDVMEEEHSEDLAIVGAGNLNKEGESQGLGSLLLWLLRKELWFIIWAILAILLAMSGSIGLLLPALLFAPLVLLVTGDIVSYAMTDLLEYGSSDKEPSGKQLLLRNLGASILVAVVIGALGAAFFGAIGQLGNGGFLIGTLGLAENVRVYLLLGFLPALLSIFVIVLLSVLVTVIARHRLEKDKPLSVLPATLVMMALGLIFQFGLTSLFTLSPLIDLVSRFALFQ